jgi:hypothetical protein
MLKNDAGQTILCSYCGENPAIIQFKNGKYCCATKVHRCPTWRKGFSISIQRSRFCKYSKQARLRKEVEAGIHDCKYCDRKARFLINGSNKCCQPKAKLCPGFHKWLSDRRKQLYKNRPELKEIQSNLMKEVHNRPEVIEKKREAMILLHNGECDTCKEFQKNYSKGRIKYRKTINRR